MTKRITALGIAALACSAAAAPTQNARTIPTSLYTTEMTGSDLQFLNVAGEAGLRQAALDELAATHARTGPVKSLGEALLKDHAAEADALKKLAAAKRVSLPAMDPRQKRADRALVRLNGEKFNKACMDGIIETQKKQIAAYEEGSHSSDAEIRQFAKKSLPGLNEHLLLAKKIAGIASAESLFKTRIPAFGAASPAAAAALEASSSPPPVASAPPASPEGSLDMADAKLIAGWAYDPEHPDEALSVEVSDGTTVLATVVAKEFRGDLKQHGKGDGRHFFMLPMPESIKDGKPHWIRVAVATSHFELPGSPKSVVVSTPASSPSPSQ